MRVKNKHIVYRYMYFISSRVNLIQLITLNDITLDCAAAAATVTGVI